MQLPLFPLHCVLFPGTVLDLQIFEARYLDMISHCMRRGEGFGVVCIQSGKEVGQAANVLRVGCEALIKDFQQRPNGLLGIRIEGGRRFRFRHSQVLPSQLRLAQVDWLEADPYLPLDERHGDLQTLLSVLVQHPLVTALGMDAAAASQGELVNRLSYLLPLSMEQKVELLALDDVGQRLERLRALVGWLQADDQ